MNRILMLAALAAALAVAQTPILTLAATTANVAGAPDSIRIDLFRWSTDAERDRLFMAWTQPSLPTTGGRGGRGRAPAFDPAPDPSAVDNDVPRVPAGRGGGRGGRGGRGGPGGAAGEIPRPTPEGSLAAALVSAPAVGRLWSSEVAGYSLRSAVKITQPDGGERILLITDRRLGAWNDSWKPFGADAASTYEFSVIELHLNPKGEGEGKLSATGKVAADSAAKIIALENYDRSPVILKTVRRK